MTYGETLFQIGVILLAAAVAGLLVTMVLYTHKKKQLSTLLETEYGKPRDREGG